MADEGSFRRFLFAFEYEVVHSRHCRPASCAGHAVHCLQVGFLIQVVDTDGSEAEFICDVCQQRQFLPDFRIRVLVRAGEIQQRIEYRQFDVRMAREKAAKLRLVLYDAETEGAARLRNEMYSLRITARCEKAR